MVMVMVMVMVVTTASLKLHKVPLELGSIIDHLKKWNEKS